MTAARKNLGDIANRALSMLEKMESGVEERLDRVADDHARSRKSGDGASIATIEGRAVDLEKDIRRFMDESMERLSTALENEVTQTEEHFTSVQGDLIKLAEKLKNSITELKKTYQENLHHINFGLTDQFEASVERSTAELEKREYDSARDVREHGTLVVNTLQQKLDHTLWESRGEEKKYNSTLFKGFMQRANTIDGHFSNLMQKLAGDFQAQFKIVEAQAELVETELEQQSGQLLLSVDNQAQEIDQGVDEFFKSCLESHSASLDQSLTTKAQDLSSVHDDTTRKLTEHTKELSTGLVGAAGEAREALAARCSDLKATMEDSIQGFRSRMDEKMKDSTALKDALEAEKLSILAEMQTDLGEIWRSFDKRMASLIADALARVRTVAEDAEKAMISTSKSSLAKLRSDGLASNREIDEAVNKFLELLAQQKTLALEEIARSAENQLMPSARAESAKPKRVKKTRENPQHDTEG